jgi:hypothetical protein
MNRLRSPGLAMRSIVRMVASGKITLMRLVMVLLGFIHIIYTLGVYDGVKSGLDGRFCGG